MVYNRSFDNTLPSFVDICSFFTYNFLLYWPVKCVKTSVLIIKVPIFFPQLFYVSLSFSLFLIATLLFLRLDIILISCIGTTNFIYLTTKRHVQQPKSKSNSQVNQPYQANAISYILHTSLFSGMINLNIWRNILGLPWDEFLMYLCGQVFLKLSCWLLPVFVLLAELYKMQITSHLLSHRFKVLFLLRGFT